MSDQQERRRGIDELHSMMRENLAKTIKIESALWPDPGQPSTLTKLDDRVSSLETARAWLTGAVAVVSTLFGAHIGLGKHK